MAGYFLMKLVERDPEALRKELPERYQEDYHNAAKQRTAQFMTVLKNVADGDDPATASRKLREQLEKEAQKNSPVPPKSS